MQGVAWGSRQYLWVTLIWCLYKRERDDGLGQAWGNEPQRISLTLGDGSLETRGRSGKLVGFGDLLLFWVINATGSEGWREPCLQKLKEELEQWWTQNLGCLLLVHGLRTPHQPSLSSLPSSLLQGFSISVNLLTSWAKGQKTMPNASVLAHHLFLSIKFYWNTTTPIHSFIVYAASAFSEWSICNGDVWTTILRLLTLWLSIQKVCWLVTEDQVYVLLACWLYSNLGPFLLSSQREWIAYLSKWEISQ